MEPRPSHNGGSLSANAGAEVTACISACGTSVRDAAMRIAVLAWAETWPEWQKAPAASMSVDAGDAAFTEAAAAVSEMRSPLSMVVARRTVPSAALAAAHGNRAEIDAFMMASLLRGDTRPGGGARPHLRCSPELNPPTVA